jgi:hypothetical protein
VDTAAAAVAGSGAMRSADMARWVGRLGISRVE